LKANQEASVGGTPTNSVATTITGFAARTKSRSVALGADRQEPRLAAPAERGGVAGNDQSDQQFGVALLAANRTCLAPLDGLSSNVDQFLPFSPHWTP
jgi:hypothetical protein